MSWWGHGLYLRGSVAHPFLLKVTKLHTLIDFIGPNSFSITFSISRMVWLWQGNKFMAKKKETGSLL